MRYLLILYFKVVIFFIFKKMTFLSIYKMSNYEFDYF